LTTEEQLQFGRDKANEVAKFAAKLRNRMPSNIAGSAFDRLLDAHFSIKEKPSGYLAGDSCMFGGS